MHSFKDDELRIFVFNGGGLDSVAGGSSISGDVMIT
jgi:hypothetical protein